MSSAFAGLRSVGAMLLAISTVSASPAVADAVSEPEFNMAVFLDRLMRAESNGQDFAANPRSTAIGPFQFIKSTFLELARRHFAAEIDGLSDERILALRTDRAYARRAAEIYTNENAAHLAEYGVKSTYASLRLAFLLGPTGAVRVLQAPSATPVLQILGSSVVQANPFMAGMACHGLIAKAERDVLGAGAVPVTASLKPVASAQLRAHVAARPRQAAPAAVAAAKPRCRPQLASCRKWQALAQQSHKTRTAEAVKANTRVEPPRTGKKRDAHSGGAGIKRSRA